jgi:hypothetical protein
LGWSPFAPLALLASLTFARPAERSGLAVGLGLAFVWPPEPEAPRMTRGPGLDTVGQLRLGFAFLAG